MKKLTLFLVAMLFSTLSFAALNPYAYGLKSDLSLDESTLTVNYSLNADATGVNIVILNGETVVETISCDGKTKGNYTVEIPTARFPKSTSLTWQVEVLGNSVATPTKQTEEFKFYLPHSMDVDVDTESDYFGRWYVIEATNGGQTKSGYQSNPLGRGLYAFDAALNPILNSAGTRGFTGGMTLGAVAPTNNDGEYFNLYRVATSGGRVFVGRFRSGYAPVLEATDLHSDDYPIVMASAQGRTVGLDVRGRGENLQLALLGTDFTLKEYNLGTAASSASPAQTKDYSSVIVRDNATITYDNEGGMWINQNDPNGEKPTILHLSAEGVDYDNVTAGLPHTMGVKMSGIAVNPNGTELAVVSPSKIIIYTISKDLEGKISLTTKYSLSTSRDNTALSYDYAGNLYAANRYSERINFYAMPYDGEVTTPAPSKYAFELTEVVPEVYTVTVEKVGEGTIEGGGEYLKNSTVILKATPAEHYEFTGWTGDVNSTENPLTVTVNSNMTITANFQEHAKYTITAVANDENMGTVTGGDTYYAGESATLKATAKSGYVFAGWTDGEKNATRTVTVSGNATYTANFQAIAPRAWAHDLKVTEEGDNYKFTFNATTAGTATLLFADIDGNPVVPTSVENPAVAGTNTILVAKAAFTENKDVYWSVKMDGEAIPAISEITDVSKGIYNFYLPQGVAVDNNPESPTFSKIYIAESTDGASDGGSDRADNQKRGIFIYDQTLAELNPTSNVGVIPSNVTLANTTRNALKRIAINPKTNELAFAYNASPAAVWAVSTENVAGEATNLLAGLGFDYCNSLCFDENGILYIFDNGAGYPAKGSLYKIVNGEKHTIFSENGKYGNADNSLASDGRGGLWIAQNRSKLDGFNQLAHVSASGVIDFEVNSTTTHGFASLETSRGAMAYNPRENILAIGCGASGTIGVSLYQVTYDPSTDVPSLEYIGATPSLGKNVEGIAFDYAGDLYALSANAERFYKFTLPTNENTCTVPAPSSQKLVLGTQCEVTVTINDPAMGSVEGAGQHEKGAEVTLTAKPVAHHRFVNWTGDKTSTDNPFKFTIEGNVALTANFEATPQWTITVTANDDSMGTVSGGGTYDEGAEVTITATPNATYRFVKWSDDVTDATRTFSAAENLTLQAIFEKVPNRAWAYDLSQVADGDNYKFSFVATTAGEATLLFADKDGNELVAPHVVGAVNAGANTVTLPQSTFAGVTKDVYWSVKMDGEEITAIAEITDQAKGIYDFVDMTGVLVDNNPDSKYFGEVYVQMALNGTVGSKTQTAGLFIFDQTLAIKNTDANAGIQPILPSGYTMGDNRNKFHRLNINPNTGDLVYSYNIASSPAVFAIDRENMAGNVTNLVEGVTGLTHTNAHCFDENGTLYVMDNASYPNTGAIYKIVDGVAKQFVANANWANASITMASDGRGGLWVSQNRGQLDGFYQLTHVTSGGTIDWYVNSSSSQGLTGHSRRGALAYDVERQILAQGRDAKVELYSVEYDATTGVPTLTSLYTVADATNIGNDIDGLAFDYAGDLYVVNTTKKKFQKFTIPTNDNICTVPAPASQKLVLGTQCEVTVNVNDPAMGSVTGAGIFEKGTEVTLTPNPVAHHRFVNWTGDMTSTDNPLKFTIEGDVNLTANFEAIPTYTITTSVNDSDMGTVTAGGTYYEDTEVTLTATANAGYVFVQWSDGVTEETRTFTAGVDMPETLTANFKVAVPRAWAYDLRLDADTDPANYIFTFKTTSAGTATLIFKDKDGNTLDFGEHTAPATTAEEKTITIVKSVFDAATKDIYWEVELAGDAIAKMAELTDPTEGIYNFYVPQGVAVDNSPNSMYFGRIYVVEGTTGANDGGSEMAKQMTAGLFVYNQTLEKVQPATGYTGIIPQNVTFNTNKPTSADEINIIRQQMHRVAVDPVTGEVAFAYYKSPATAIYSMNPDDLAGNAQNLIEGSSITYANSLCFDSEGTLYVMNNANTGLTGGQIYKVQDDEVTLFAAHDKNNQWAVYDNAMASDGRGGLWIAQNRYGYDYPILSHVNKDGVVDFAVKENLTGWFPNNNTGSSYRGQLAYNLNENILAFAGNKMVTLFTVEYDGNGKPTINKLMSTPLLGGNIDGVAFDYAGDLYAASASSERLYKFVVPTNTNTCIVPAPESQVIQKETRYIVTVKANPAEGGTVSVSDGGNAVEGATLEVTATANTGYRFVNWTKDAEEVSTSASFEYTVPAEDVTLVANFEALPEIVYELNGGVWNKYDWTSKKDMYNALLDDWRAYSGSTRTNVTYEAQLGIGKSKDGIPTTITSVDDRVALMDLFTDATYAPKWGWLATYVDAVAVAQSKTTQPTTSAGHFTYALGNFFGEDNANATNWMGAVDFTGEEAHITAFAPYWGQTFPMPTQPTEEVILNAPYKEGYLFDGWYATSNFSGEEVTVVDENTNGTLYAKWLKHFYTRDVTNGYFGTICLPYGSSSYSGAEFYEIAYLELQADGVTPKDIWLDEVTGALEAGKPYIFKATSTLLIVNYEGDEELNPVDGKAGLTGTFIDIPTTNTVLEGNYMIAQNRFWLCGTGCWLDANRAYIEHDALHANTDPVSPMPGRRRVSMGAAGENTTTGVNNLTEGGAIAPNVEGTYDVLGRKFTEPNGTGFYIVNGKKVVIVK